MADIGRCVAAQARDVAMLVLSEHLKDEHNVVVAPGSDGMSIALMHRHLHRGEETGE